MENIAHKFTIVSCFIVFASISASKTVVAHTSLNGNDATAELVDFKASYNGNFTLLEWITESSSSGYFIVEVSHDEEKWEAIAEVRSFKKMHDYKSFSYIDNNNILNDSYYRLQYTIEAGEIEYSQVVMVKVNPLNQLRLFPIPTKNILNIKGHSGLSDDVEFKITDLNGNNYPVGNKIKISEGHYTIDFSSLQPNTYFVKISCNGKNATYRVLKL